MMTNVNKIEKLLEELLREVKNAGGAMMAAAIVPSSDEESTILGCSYGSSGSIASAILEAEKNSFVPPEILHCYNIIKMENKCNNQLKND
jgi:hypothetical protein